MISSNKAQLTIKEKCTNINLKRLSRPGGGNNIHNRSKYSRQIVNQCRLMLALVYFLPNNYPTTSNIIINGLMII